MKKNIEKILELANVLESHTSTKKQIRQILNILLLITVFLVLIVFLTILFSMSTALYPPFIVLISIMLGIFALKSNMRDKVIDHHVERAKIIATRLHILIPNINIMLQMLNYISGVYNGKSITSKYQLKYVKNIYEKMTDELYQRENIVLLEPEAVKLMENIILDSTLIYALLDLTIEKMSNDFIGIISKEHEKNEIVNVCERLNKNLADLQENIIETIQLKTKDFRRNEKNERLKPLGNFATMRVCKGLSKMSFKKAVNVAQIVKV